MSKSTYWKSKEGGINCRKDCKAKTGLVIEKLDSDKKQYREEFAYM